MHPSILERIASIDTEVVPANARATTAALAEFHSHDFEGIHVRRGVSYGSFERNIANIFTPADAKNAPVLVFVHGGNFVAGHCEVPGTPFYDNVGLWAARQGWVGVTVTYRLAPEHQYPVGSDDVADSLEWVLDTIADFGGDPSRVVVVGASAGGVHVSTSLKRRDSLRRLNGVVLVSTLYSIEGLPREPVLSAYYSSDVDLEEVSPLGALQSTAVRMLLTVSEFDPPEHQRQFELARNALLTASNESRVAIRLPGHNHFSSVLSLGLGGDSFEKAIIDFLEENR